MSFIDKILLRKEFEEKPPVLVDIGASGNVHHRWRKITKYSICITFEPDSRKFGYIQKESKHYKKLFVFNCGAGNDDEKESKFYLTRSPYCSSFLKPNIEKLRPYSFAYKFIVENEVIYSIRGIRSILNELNIPYVDWYKSDSQGWDLRIFSSIGNEIIQKIIAAEFEPGIMDAYEGEDKLHQVLAYMEKFPFFLSRLDVKGISRISCNNLGKISSIPVLQKIAIESHKQIAGWGEMLYLNTFEGDYLSSIRDYLLGIAIAILNQEYGFALELSQKARSVYNDSIFHEIEQYCIWKIRNTILNVRLVNAIRKKLFH